MELFDDLDAVARDAGGALDREAQPCLFDRLSWYRLLDAHCEGSGRRISVRAREGERSAWLFLELAGSKAESWSNYYSLRWQPVGDPSLYKHLLAFVRKQLASSLEVAPVQEAGYLTRACREAGWLPFLTEASGNWIADTAGLDFDAYWARRPGKLRSTVARKAKAAKLDIRVLRTFDEAAWADYEAVYRASWKPEEGSPAFLRALARQEGSAGTLRLGLAYREGRPVAAQFWLVENDEATIHKLAYCEDAKALSPGSILSMQMFRHVLDQDRVARIDYGTGDEGYKADWMDARRPLWRVTAYDPTSLSGLAGAARTAASALVGRLRSR